MTIASVAWDTCSGLGHYSIVKVLLKSGADPSIKTNKGETARMIAIRRHNLDVARVLQ